MSTVLITGVAGLLGSHFSRHLLDRGHTVVGIDDLSGGYRDHLDPRTEFVEMNLTDSKKLNDVFGSKRPDYVYHFAAYAAVGLSPFIRSFNYTNNVVASANVINSCINHGTKKIVFTSSMDVYGSLYAPPYTEDFIPMPEDPYGIAKFAVEMDLKHAARFLGLRYTVVRPHNIFGIYQNIWDKYRNVLGIWIRQTLSGQPLTVYGDGSQVRSFSDVKYYMEPFEALMEVGDGETYNLGADSHTTIISAAHRLTRIAEKMGHSPKIVHLQPRDEVKEAYCDHTKAKNDLGFIDGTDFDALVAKMFEWASAQPSRPVRKMQYEVEKNMYDFWKV
jgi:UDP-glucose 4-epimerase